MPKKTTQQHLQEIEARRPADIPRKPNAQGLRAEVELLRKQRTPAEELRQLRSNFHDERRDPALWATLPEPLQRHWAELKKDAGEKLTAVEVRALEAAPRIERRAFNADGKLIDFPD